MSQDNNGRHLRPDKDGTNQQLKMLDPFLVIGVCGVEFQDDKIGRIGQVVRGTVGIVG